MVLIASFSILSLFTAFAQAITFGSPPNVISGQDLNVTWTATATDPPFDLSITHPQFHDALTIRNNVDPALEILLITVPQVPVNLINGYALRASNIKNRSDIYTESTAFGITTSTSTVSGATSTGSNPPITSGLVVLTTSSSDIGTTNAVPGATTANSPSTASATPLSNSNAAMKLPVTNIACLAISALAAGAGAMAFVL